jgi:GTP-binding protein HflX
MRSESFTEIKDNLCELEELAEAAGCEIVGSLTQILAQYHPATLLGSGKVEELKALVQESSASMVIVDHQLSGIQCRNLEKELLVPVLDRNQVIIDIFAMRAHTHEGKLQVELAQMLDQLPRMVDAWMGSLSRQGGGVGTRGPGETALEMDRRRIRDRMKQIKKQLESVKKHRAQHRASRKRNKIPSFALIGYTNTGKSTLINQLTQSQLFVQDQVFATLDPTTRKIFLPDGPINAVLTDTVGFIRNLPTNLIEAFKATLEETAEADILIHVVDLSSPFMARQVEVVDQLIEEFNWQKKPIIHVFNKIDQAPFAKQFQIKAFPRVFVSAQTGEGIDRLKSMMSETVKSLYQEVELFFPKTEEYKIYELGRETQITKREAASSGTLCLAHMTPQLLTRWQDYLVSVEHAG